MSFADLPPGTHAANVRNHWWTRPGWSEGRQFYTWHLTFDGADELHRLVGDYHQVLGPLPGLTLVPVEWLHLTMQGVGFTDEVPDTERDTIISSVRDKLSAIEPHTLVFGPAIVSEEAIVLPPENPQEITQIRTLIRETVKDVRGSDNLPDPRFRPHVSAAYIDQDCPSDPYVEAVESIRPKPATVTVRNVSLIALRRDHHAYRWHVKGIAPVGR